MNPTKAFPPLRLLARDNFRIAQSFMPHGYPAHGRIVRHDMPLTSGTRLGPYEVLAPIGAGGMGEVYRARDTRLDRTVAVKILPSHLSENLDAKQRFDREARTISSVNHPNICTLYDVVSGLPCVTVRSAPAIIVSGPAQRSLTLWPACSPSRLATLCSRKLRQLCCLRCRFDCYRVERTSSRAGVAPAEVQRLSRRTVTPVNPLNERPARSPQAGRTFGYCSVMLNHQRAMG
jgi:hypothetical protein